MKCIEVLFINNVLNENYTTVPFIIYSTVHDGILYWLLMLEPASEIHHEVKLFNFPYLRSQHKKGLDCLHM